MVSEIEPDGNFWFESGKYTAKVRLIRCKHVMKMPLIFECSIETERITEFHSIYLKLERSS